MLEGNSGLVAGLDDCEADASAALKAPLALALLAVRTALALPQKDTAEVGECWSVLLQGAEGCAGGDEDCEATWDAAEVGELVTQALERTLGSPEVVGVVSATEEEGVCEWKVVTEADREAEDVREEETLAGGESLGDRDVEGVPLGERASLAEAPLVEGAGDSVGKGDAQAVALFASEAEGGAVVEELGVERGECAAESVGAVADAAALRVTPEAVGVWDCQALILALGQGVIENEVPRVCEGGCVRV